VQLFKALGTMVVIKMNMMFPKDFGKNAMLQSKIPWKIFKGLDTIMGRHVWHKIIIREKL